jgi:dTDP-N-acetylfucosamine:lipid II N-acetylfucosaminyltransferase
MFLHLLKDSPFVDKIIEYSTKEGGSHTFIVFGDSLKFTKQKDRVLLVRNCGDLSPWQHTASNYSKVFIHFLSDDAVDFVLSNKHYSKFYWFFWGADGYRIDELNLEIYLPETRLFVNNNLSNRAKLKLIKDAVVRPFVKSRRFKAIQLINFCCTWVDGDFLLAKKLNPSIKHVYFAYLSSNELFDQESDVMNFTDIGDSLNILLGNSLDISNNHLDAITYLKSLKLDIDTIIIPLSYGGNTLLKERIIEKSNNEWGEKGQILEEFMPLDQYLTLISKVDVVIFYHVRQQAANNALSLLWMGKIIIMHPNSLLFATLKSWGLSVLSSSEVKEHTDLKDFIRRNSNRKSANRAILEDKFSYGVVSKLYSNLLMLNHS